jgi:hypothetical protein
MNSLMTTKLTGLSDKPRAMITRNIHLDGDACNDTVGYKFRPAGLGAAK